MDRRNYDAGPYDTTGRIFNVLAVNHGTGLFSACCDEPSFEQTIAVRMCCFAHHRGIARSGPKSTPPGNIQLGGVEHLQGVLTGAPARTCYRLSRLTWGASGGPPN